MELEGLAASLATALGALPGKDSEWWGTGSITRTSDDAATNVGYTY